MDGRYNLHVYFFNMQVILLIGNVNVIMAAMIKTNDKQLTEIVTEIIRAEQKRAQKLIDDYEFKRWLTSFRQKYLINGFLLHLYGHDRDYSQSSYRVRKLGTHVLSEEAQDKIIDGDSQSWLRREETWFWAYLDYGQEILESVGPIPAQYKMYSNPAILIWQEITAILKKFQLFGENNGGIIFSPNWIDEKYLTSSSQITSWDEGDDSYLESCQLPGKPNWIKVFDIYQSYQLSPSDIEIRSAWFHLANHAFFNKPLAKLPIFYALFNEKGNVEQLRFLDKTLSDRARDYIGQSLLELPVKLKQQIMTDIRNREKREMVWWLWHNVGHRDKKKKLSYRRIGSIVDSPPSTVQAAVERFNLRLKNKMDANLLGRLLETASNVGLGNNLTYKVLEQQGLVPAREREIDGFDNIYELI